MIVESLDNAGRRKKVKINSGLIQRWLLLTFWCVVFQVSFSPCILMYVYKTETVQGTVL